MDRKDLQLLGPIAAMIGARLHYPNPLINGQGNPWVSTILVEQHKEKFFYIRVYCKLAEPGMVKAKWDWIRAHQEMKSKIPSSYFPSDDVSEPEPTQAFIDKCFRRDAFHYRRVYLDAVKVIPRLKRRIIAQADYRELLFDNPQELCDHVDELAKVDPEYPNTDNLAYYRNRWHAKDAEELKVVLFKYYEEPSLRDRIGE